MASFQGLAPRIFWGLTTSIKGNINYVSDLDVLYPAGGVLVIHNYVQMTQFYIKLPEPQKVLNIICVSPNKKIIAIAEEGDKPCISLYDVKSMKRKKVLGLPYESSAKEFVSIAFTFDSRYLVAVVGEPDWMMLFYNWEKGKVESQTRANNPPANTGPVTQVCPNPTDGAVVVIVGPGLFRLMSVSDTVWRQYGFQKADKMPIKCVCWITPDRVLAGTEDDRLIVVEYGDLRGRYRASVISEFDVQVLEDQPGAYSYNTECKIDSDKEVTCVLAFSNGFAYSIANYIIVFEKQTKYRYKRKNVYRIGGIEIRGEMSEEMNTIRNLAVNPAQDRILATTQQSQIYYSALLPADAPASAADAMTVMDCLGESLHHGPIAGLATCAWKTIFMTCGEIDRTVRVWDLTTESLILTKHYQEDIFSVALHPTGLYATVGFSDKLRFMLVLLDDLNTIREFSIRTCRQVAFSNTGNMFAAVNASTIQVFCVITFQCVYYLKGHNEYVRSLVWTPDDRSLFSCGSDGAIYEWNTYDGTRANDVITKQCDYMGLATSQDGKLVYGVGSDGLLKEINNAEILREESLHHSCLYAVQLSRSDQMMFCTGTKGAILSVRYPLLRPPEFAEFFLHNNPVTMIKLSYDDLNLISCSNDGTMCIWKLINTDRKCIKMDPDFSYSKEILINKEDLGEKIQQIKYLENLVKSLETDHAYQIKEMETEHSNKVQELHNGYCAAIQNLKDKNQELVAEHTVEINKMNSNSLEMKREHMAAMEKLESNYNAKLIVEYDKYAALDEKDKILRDKLLRQIDELTKSKELALKRMAEEYEEKLKAKDAIIQELHDTQNLHSSEHEEIKRQIEEDADQEIIDLRTKFEQALRTEKDTNVRLRGETGVMKKKFLAAQKEIDELKHQVSALHNEHQQLKVEIVNREQDITNLKKEIFERDYTITENERRFSEVKNKNQELDKFKFVLNHKIKELRMQIQPKEEEIKQKKEQIQDMEEEINEYQQKESSLQLEIAELKEGVGLREKDYQKEKKLNKETQAILRRIRYELHELSALVQEPLELKRAVINLYHKYSEGKQFEHSRQEDRDAQNEFLRQRDHLERTVDGLKRKLYYKESTKKNTTEKIMKDNVILIEEVNALRKELVDCKRHVKDLESIVGMHKFITPREAQKKLQMAVQTKESIHEEYKYKIKELEDQIGVQQNELAQLIVKNKQLEEKLKKKVQLEEKPSLRPSEA
ncbi:cilia- and flagella-associated protein 57-like [Macrosteles quadrilineatus]|uniref:cilia- and flagella-associated protein 57-like n=1 Tax=Macrosteles quadrilineatus TaxID=74068 RepID=UPI0023E28DD2|nr:cilia- and flagella-associated protein 57-like [Macrosteles quadrilineatus]